MVTPNVSAGFIAHRFKKMSLRCAPERRGSHEVFVQLQRGHRILSDADARQRHEAEG